LRFEPARFFGHHGCKMPAERDPREKSRSAARRLGPGIAKSADRTPRARDQNLHDHRLALGRRRRRELRGSRPRAMTIAGDDIGPLSKPSHSAFNRLRNPLVGGDKLYAAWFD
jgi:hypothetical protein